jgi:hypothetical protein
MTTQFTHDHLDGTWARLLGPAVLEYRDPNDGQSADPALKTRHQYTLVNGILLSRRLPAEVHGDRWIDPATGKPERRPPAWESVEVPGDWTLLEAWIRHVWTADLPAPWSMGGSCAYGLRSNGVSMVWMLSLIEIRGTDWPQQLPCPHCRDWIVWAEAGYVPGRRICRGCHRHWRITEDSGPGGAWVLRRARGHGWPYGEAES